MTRQPSIAAQVAKTIRQGLKAKGLDAKVSKRDFNCVNITLKDPSPTEYKEAHDFCKLHQSGHFCGMTDIYVDNNIIEDMLQIEYVFVSAVFSDELKQEALDGLSKRYNLGDVTLGSMPRYITIDEGRPQEHSGDMINRVLNGRTYPLSKFWEDRAA